MLSPKKQNRRLVYGLIAAILFVLMFVLSCAELEQKYIRQDKLYRIAYIEDSRNNDKFINDSNLLSDPDPGIRSAAAYAIGRIGSDYYLPALKDNLYDSILQPAQAKYFAAGLAGDSSFIDTLFALARNSAPASDMILEALGRLGDSTIAPRLAVFLQSDDSLVVYQAILAIWRSAGWSEAGTIAQIGLETNSRLIKWGALYALSRGRRIEGQPLFRAMLSDPDPELRMQAFLGLGRSADTASLDLIAIGLNDIDPRVAQASLYALQSFGPMGSKYIGDKLPQMRDEKLVGMAVTAIGKDPYPKALPVLEKVFVSDQRENVVGEAARALLQTGGVNSLILIDKKLTDPTVYQSLMIAEGLATIDKLAAKARLIPLFNHEIPIVRATSLESLCRVDSSGAAAYIRTALADADIVVIATAIDQAAKLGIYDLIPEIAGIYLKSKNMLDDDLKRSIIGAWSEFKEVSPSPYDSLMIETLKEASNDDWFLIRKEAAELMFTKFGIDRRNQVGIARSKISQRNYRNRFQKYKTNPIAVIETSRGTVEIELLYKEAPLTVGNFIALAEKQFYDSSLFHRVVPNFVAQDGCPRGDGWGGPDYTIRCEYNRLTYKTGMVGMAHSGKDTGGSQYFITLSPQPHLDARYTIFGRVVSGMETVQQIVRGDSIQSVSINYGEDD